MKKYKTQIILASVLTLLPLVFLLLFPGQFSIPVFAPFLFLAMNLLCIWLVSKDNENNPGNWKFEKMVIWIIPVLSNIVFFLSGWNMDYSSRISMRILFFAMGVIFLVFGNQFPKLTPNQTMGIRIPWVYTSEENWIATHRFAGKVWVICGLLMMAGAFLPANFVVFGNLVPILAAAILPVFYSWNLYRKNPKPAKEVVVPAGKSAGITTGIGVLILAIALAFLFTGKVSVEFEEDVLKLSATLSSSRTIAYDEIESMERLESFDPGEREFGVGSLQILAGRFYNPQLDDYTLFAYTHSDAWLQLDTSDGVIVIGLRDGEEMDEIQSELEEKLALTDSQ